MMILLFVVFLTIKCSKASAETNLGLEGVKVGKKKGNDHISLGGYEHARRLPQDFILESLALLRTQTTSTNIFLKDIMKTFNNFEERLGKMEDQQGRTFNNFEKRLSKMEDLQERTFKSFEERLGKMEDQQEVKMKACSEINIKEQVALKKMITNLEAGIAANREISGTIKARQNVMLSEVRLISLYKLTDQTTTPGGKSWGYGGHDSGYVVDGQFVFSHWEPSTPVRTIAHTADLPNQKISIDLGGLFRIHRVKIWHARHCCKSRSLGLRILADEKLLGVTSTVAWTHDFKVSENDPIYAKSVTLHRLERNYMNVIEIQVWGTGPFAEDDKFA